MVMVNEKERDEEKLEFEKKCLKDGKKIGRKKVEKEKEKMEKKDRWYKWNDMVGKRKEDKRRDMDDYFIGEKRVNVVEIRSNELNGMGLKICGNMRDGIFVKDVMKRGKEYE